MEFYNIAKYQNIQDRIKRLAANPPSTPSTNNAPPKNNLKMTNASISVNSRYPVESRPVAKFEDKLKLERINTSQKEENIVQKQSTLISDLLSFRDNQITSKQKMEKLNIYGKAAENKLQENAKLSEKKILKKENLKIEESKVEDIYLENAKSQNNSKVNEILSNFKSYRLNKQKFMESQEKVSTHRQDENDVSLLPEAQIRQKMIMTKKKQNIFQEIDNIWNKESVEQEKSPQFQRKADYCKYLQEGPSYQNKYEIQNMNEGLRPRTLEKSKQILKNNSINRDSQTFNNPSPNIANLGLSPRGIRIPGKICRNHDRTSSTINAKFEE